MFGLSTAWGAFRALSWFAKGAGWLTFIPVVGPILGPIVGFVAALVQLIVKVLTRALQGITSIMHNPREVCAVIVLMMFWGALCMHWGMKINRHVVLEAKAQINSLLSGLEDEDASELALAEAAAVAGKAAEEIEREKIAHERAVAIAPKPKPSTELAPIRTLLEPASPPLEEVPSVNIPEPPAVKPVGVLAQPAAKNKNRRRQSEPGLFESLSSVVGKAFN